MFSASPQKLLRLAAVIAINILTPQIAMTKEILQVRAERVSQMDNKTVKLRYELIRRALQVSGHKFNLSPCDLPANEVSDMRYTRMVKENKGCNVTSTSAGSSTTEGLLLVPVPIYLGAGGYRVLFINKASRTKVETVKTLDDLRTISIGSGISWVDTDIMRSANLQVEVSNYENLFSMLERGRFDGISRSILEVFNESTLTQNKQNIEIDSHLLLHYPNDLFFYVSPLEPQIQKALTSGMEKLYVSGELMRMLRHIVGTPAEMSALRLPGRVRINLPNPYLKPDEASALKKYASVWVK